MKYELTITLSPEDQDNPERITEALLNELTKQNASPHPRATDITAYILQKKSIDARHGRIKVYLKYTVYIGETPSASAQNLVPAWRQADPAKQVVIVGSGPAGLFAALTLLEQGVTPIILERGKETPERKRDIADITRLGSVHPDSNYCFGEGGAGTFSDGKLYTRSNKRGDISRILSILHHHGADASICTEAHPHIGSDLLPGIINAIRATIVSHGGIFKFNTRCTNFIHHKGILKGVIATSVDHSEEILCDCVILASGHSARDIYHILSDLENDEGIQGPLLEAKDFAMGVRIEHQRDHIDAIQYHGKRSQLDLPAASYRLSAQIQERGVYSFCMCPGGLIVPSMTEDGLLCVNGMSPSGRNSRWSNAAIVVEIRSEDIPTGKDCEKDALRGLYYQMEFEREAARQGNKAAAPAQRLVDFIDSKQSTSLPESSYSPGLVSSRLDQWLPAHILSRLAPACMEFNRFMKGFISPEAILVAPETRTSAPVRILRDPQTCESPALSGLFPAGEGSGYAGGIASSAMDGEKAARAVLVKKHWQ